MEIIVSGPPSTWEKARSLLFGWPGFHYALAFVEDTVGALSIAMDHVTPDLSGPTRQTSLGCPASRNTGKSGIAETLLVRHFQRATKVNDGSEGGKSRQCRGSGG